MGDHSSLELDSSGNPVVSYYDGDIKNLKLLHCNDPNCAGGDESVETIDGTIGDDVGKFSSLELDSSGNPVIAYYDATGGVGALKIIHCGNSNCSTSSGSGSGGSLSFLSGTEDIKKDGVTYTRWFSVENVNRTDGDILPTSSGGTEDTSTQKVTVHVTWPFFGDTASIKIVEYITRHTRNSVTVFTDWSGTSTSDIITSPNNNYSTSTNIDFATGGEIKLSGSNITGDLVSNIFDTGFANGVKINTVLWQGSFGSIESTVKFQIASANCPGGESDPPTCSSGGWGVNPTGDGAYIGIDGSSSTFYGPSDPNTGYAITEDHHSDVRYFRYKVQLDKSGGATTPTVLDVIINWSP